MEIQNISNSKLNVPKITNFRMAKRCAINLEFGPKDLDNYADYFLLSYQEPSPIIDIYEKNGSFFERINISESLEQQGNLQLLSI